MFGTQFWFFNLVAPIIIVEDLYPSYILKKKSLSSYPIIFFLSSQIPQTQSNLYTYPPTHPPTLPSNPSLHYFLCWTSFFLVPSRTSLLDVFITFFAGRPFFLFLQELSLLDVQYPFYKSLHYFLCWTSSTHFTTPSLH